MGQKTRKRLLLAKIESTYGNDALPVVATDAVVCRSIEVTPIEGALLENPIIRPNFGNYAQIHVGTHVKLEVEVALAGSGTATTPPNWGVLARACGMAETIGVSDVTYNLASDGHESATLYFNQDGNLHALLGARGTVEFTLDSQGYPVAKFSFTGLFVDVSAAPQGSPDFSAVPNPISIEDGNTAFTLHGQSAVMSKLTIDLANDVAHRPALNGESVDIVDRKPAGSVVIDSPVVSTYDWFAKAKNNVADALQLIHGTVAGNILQIDAPKVQLLQPKYGDDKGTVTLEMSLSLIPDSAGDDEFVLTTK
ncbi:hypothetical protein NO559_07770 [Dasania sp. GY-MA-18]|uniref:Uncharacterized protein n=1 Tax=Dasania phycosphaerae TaxID=2950436 RepID=A0A9J6RK71_9GAMM|nr:MULTISPECIES: phage tail tube protein [Dasania]MCR8922664.1 hypothetical protein [Dasania sp. GY-MA-18]MCZ0865094.1 hypothetical protein [Dasania phycosphaerae]MCZ0868820.1 hypothetical protein [Dasania phycosphaerae]